MMKRVAWAFARIRFFLRFFGRGGVAAARYAGVTVGRDCRIYTTSFGSEPWLIFLGDRVTVTSGVKFITHDGTTWLMRDERGRRYRYAPIHVGSDVFIGINSILMPGVVIGDRCIVAAGTVVTKSLPSGYIAAGVPARIIGRYSDYENRALNTYPSEVEMNGTPSRETINRLIEGSAPEMQVPDELLRPDIQTPS